MASQFPNAAERKTVLNLKSLPYKCVLCKEWFAKAHVLQSHMGSAHGLVEEEESDDGENDVDTYFSQVPETPESSEEISSSNNQGDSSLEASSTEGSNQIVCNSYIDNILDVPINNGGNQIVQIGQGDDSLDVRTIGISNKTNSLTVQTMDGNHISHNSYSNNQSGADAALQEATRIIGRIFNEHDYHGNQRPPCIDQLTPDQLDKVVSIERTNRSVPPQREPSSTDGDISGTANTLARLISRLNKRCSTSGVKDENNVLRDGEGVQDVGYGAGAGAEVPGAFDGWGCGENAAAAALVEIGMRGNGHDYLAHGAELGDSKGGTKRKNQEESSQKKKKKKKVIKKATSEKNKMASGKKKKVIKKKLNGTSKSSSGKKKKKVISNLQVVTKKPSRKKLVTKKKKKINQPACKKGVDKVKKKVNASKEKTSSKLAGKSKKEVNKPAPMKVVGKAKKSTTKTSPDIKPVVRRRRKLILPIVFPCMFCGNTYDNDKDLQLHRAAECGKNNHRCNKCAPLVRKRYARELEDIARSVEKVRDVTDSTDYKYVAGKRLLVHYYQCFVCNQGYANHLHYCRHLNTHHTVRCQFCYLVYSSVIGLGKHMRCHERGPLKCVTCSKTYFSSAMLLAHMKGHTSDFSCKLCDVTFEFKDNIVRHNRELHSGYPIPPKPVEDKAEIKTPPTIATKDQKQVPHLEDAPKDTPLGSTFQCKFCNKIFRKEETLELHLHKFHIDQFKDPSSGKYICEICGAVKPNANILRKHLRSHKDPKHECPQCRKTFSHRQALTVHIESVHEKKREFQCQYCGKAVASKASLVDHERLHTGEKPYKCDECGKCYRLISEYQSHRAKEHSDLRPFQCTECPKQFAFRDKLRRHQRTHRPQELCSCDQCGKVFVRADLLKEHMVVHRWVFACEHCDRKFSSPDARSYHMLKIHKIDPYRILQDISGNPPTAAPETQKTVPEETSSAVGNGVPDRNDRSVNGGDSPSEMKAEDSPFEISDSDSDMDTADADLAATSILAGLFNGELVA